MNPTPAIPGYLFHTTSFKNALFILKDGFLRPSVGSISFSKCPWFGSSVEPFGITFVFPEDIIKEKYGGVDEEYTPGSLYEQEEEVSVGRKLVYLTDCVEILPLRATIWKYGIGYRYHFKDIRQRTVGVRGALKRVLPPGFPL